MAAQLTFTNGPGANGLLRCMCAASSSLPVPDSPASSTRASDRATWVACSMTWRNAGLEPIMRGPSPTSSRSRAFSCCRAACSSAFFNTSRRRSRPRGFSRKSKAPARVAATASAIVAWPEIMITGARPSETSGSRSRPLASGSRTSSRYASARRRGRRRRNSPAVRHTSTRYPAPSSTRRSDAPTFSSSSTIRIVFTDLASFRGRPEGLPYSRND